MALNFLKRFDKYLKEKGIKHKYPSRMSTYKWICERANRTLQDEFINEKYFFKEMMLIHLTGNLCITSYVTILKDLVRV